MRRCAKRVPSLLAYICIVPYVFDGPSNFAGPNETDRERERERESFIRNNFHDGVVSMNEQGKKNGVFFGRLHYYCHRSEQGNDTVEIDKLTTQYGWLRCYCN